MDRVHDFNERLAWSQQASDESFWQDVYRQAFPDFNTMSTTIGDRAAQKEGIDRVVTLDNGEVRRIDEKKRNRTYPDILLEFISNDKTNSPGWMNKALRIDYLAYAFMDTERVYFFNWDFLRRAWTHYRNDWLARYPHKIALNNGYKTHSVAVPIKVLVGAMNLACVIDRKPRSNEELSA